MIETPTRESEACAHVGQLEVRKLLDDLTRAQSRGEQIEHVDDPDAHAADAGAATTLVRVHRDALHEFDGLPQCFARGRRSRGRYAPGGPPYTDARRHMT